MHLAIPILAMAIDHDAYTNAIRFIEALDRRYPGNIDAGWIYVMRNREFAKRLLKIGMTTRPPHDRAVELAGTGVPGAFEVVYFVHVRDARTAEGLAHQHLAPFRYQTNKEFFEVSIGKAVSALDRVAELVPLLRSQRNKGSRHPRSKPLPQAFGFGVRECSRCSRKNRVRELAIVAYPKCASCGSEL